MPSSASRAVSRLFWAGPLLLWLAFAAYTLEAARDPGFVADREHAPYPWRGVLVTWLVLAISTAPLYGILRPWALERPGRRLVQALGYAAVLLALDLSTFAVTDMPGYVYVPFTFALALVVLLLPAAVVVVLRERAP